MSVGVERRPALARARGPLLRVPARHAGREHRGPARPRGRVRRGRRRVRRSRPVRALACPASFKGALSAPAAARALAEGLRAGGPTRTSCPVADGGEGTAEVLRAALGGEWREAYVHDPLGRPLVARWLLLPDGTGVVEAAAAIGLPLLDPAELEPLRGDEPRLRRADRGRPRRRSRPRCSSASAAARRSTAARARGRRWRDITPWCCTVRARSATSRRGWPTRRGCSGRRRARPPPTSPSSSGGSGPTRELRPYAELPGSGAAGGLGAGLAALGAELVPGAELRAAGDRASGSGSKARRLR